MDPETVVGRNIRRLRLLRRLSQEALAHDVGIAARHLGRIERGANSTTLGVLVRIAESLGCETANLMAQGDAAMPANLPRGRHVRDEPPPHLVAREQNAVYETEQPVAEIDRPDARFHTLRTMLTGGPAGPYSAEAEKVIAAIVADAGGEKRLSAAHRRRIDMARA